ncbi:MAG: sigma-54 interaction domain-containing protein [Gammaproteobacteria bacterium]
MKQTAAEGSISKELFNWLAQFDCDDIIKHLIQALDAACFYIVDGEQRVLHWSRGLETVSGYRREVVIGNICLPEFNIISGINGHKQRLTISLANGQRLELNKTTQPLRNRSGVGAGGIGVLFPIPEDAEISRLPKISPDAGPLFQGILSRSPAMQNVFQIIRNAAETEATVLVRGESGSGKELAARAIHNLSARRHAPFLAINCAALSSNLLESELFGHVRGAFTGAIKDHKGLFQRAHGGTLFLDEVAELPLELQAKLLRVLQERNYIPVGGDRLIDVDVRIVAATHRSLREEVRNGHFREDLMYRLRVVPIFIPPLRERREDISLLIWHFIRQHNAEKLRHIEKIEPAAMRVLLDYPWPGNIRELHNVVEYAFAVGRGTTLRLTELPPEFREPKSNPSTARTRGMMTTEQEKEAIRKALDQCSGEITQAAGLLGMSRATFWRKRKQHGI